MKVSNVAGFHNYINKNISFGRPMPQNDDYHDEKIVLSKALNEIKNIRAGITDMLEMQYYMLKKPIHDSLQKKLGTVENAMRDVIEDNNW